MIRASLKHAATAMLRDAPRGRRDALPESEPQRK
nr:MAG TPA: hypothetical protein [Caudoviricetes sp.]